MKETLRHREAFEYYYILGEKRSFKLVEGKFKVSNMSVARWSKLFNWQLRIVQRDIENSKALTKKINKDVVNSKADYRALIKKVVKKFEDKLDKDKIQICRTSDLAEMANLDLKMMGEATDELEITVKLPEELKGENDNS